MNRQLAIEYYNKGLQRVKEKKWDEALELLNKAIAEDPNHVNAYNALGKVHIQKGDPEAARRCWRTALKIDPDNVTAKQCLATAYEGLFKTLRRGSKPHIKLRKDAVPQPPLEKGEWLLPLRKGKWSLIKKLFPLNKGGIRGLLWPAISALLLVALIATNLILFSRINNLKIELAKVKAELETQDTPSEHVSVEGTAPAYAGVAELPKLQTESQVTESYNRALSACLSGQYEQAIPTFRQVLEYPSPHPLKDNAQYWLAECYYSQKKYPQALVEFQKVKELFPKADKVFDAELKVAYTYYKLGYIEEAKQKLSQLSKDYWPDQQYLSKISALSDIIKSGGMSNF